jgi:hypothetical protein
VLKFERERCRLHRLQGRCWASVLACSEIQASDAFFAGQLWVNRGGHCCGQKYVKPVHFAGPCFDRVDFAESWPAGMNSAGLNFAAVAQAY